MSKPCTETSIPFDVFLSHSHENAQIIELLGAKLEDEANLKVWLDKWVLIPGNNWQQEMALGLEQAKTCAICISNDTPKGWFREEIERALNRRAKDDSFRVIPVILPNGDRKAISGEFLELRTWAEFKDGINDGYAFHVLVSGILGKPPGRYKPPTKLNNPDLTGGGEIASLELLKTLRERGLIDISVAIGFQRDIVGPIIRRQGERL